MAKDINKSVFPEETRLKLDLFRECYREWFPVFVHNPFIKHIFVYDMFAGSGKDASNNPGSPIILFQESRGNNKQHCKSLLEENSPKITFAFNELNLTKKIELEKMYQKNSIYANHIVRKINVPLVPLIILFISNTRIFQT